MVVQVLSRIHHKQLFFSIKENTSLTGIWTQDRLKFFYQVPSLPSELSHHIHLRRTINYKKFFFSFLLFLSDSFVVWLYHGLLQYRTVVLHNKKFHFLKIDGGIQVLGAGRKITQEALFLKTAGMVIFMFPFPSPAQCTNPHPRKIHQISRTIHAQLFKEDGSRAKKTLLYKERK